MCCVLVTGGKPPTTTAPDLIISVEHHDHSDRHSLRSGTSQENSGTGICIFIGSRYSSTNKSRFPIINRIDFECEECRELHDLLMATVLWIFNL